MAKILLHDQQYMIGGPKAVLDSIESFMVQKGHEVYRIAQTEACGFSPIKACKFISKYKREISKHNADSIYICGLEYVGFLMTIAAKLSNVKKVVLSVHGSAWDLNGNSLRKFILSRIIEPIEVYFADSIITVCDAAQRSIGALKFAKKGHNRGVIYNVMPHVRYEDIKYGQFRTEYNISYNKIVVAVVGRVVEDKGHKYIIEALKAINDMDFVFVIVGDGDYLNVYREEFKQYIEDGKLILTGKRNDVNNILKDSDIFLFATLHENHSIALLEAINMRCAVICTEVGGNPEIIENNVSGILIPLRDSDTIVEELSHLKDSDTRSRYCRNAFESASIKFSENATLVKLERILTTK